MSNTQAKGSLVKKVICQNVHSAAHMYKLWQWLDDRRQGETYKGYSIEVLRKHIGADADDHLSSLIGEDQEQGPITSKFVRGGETCYLRRPGWKLAITIEESKGEDYSFTFAKRTKKSSSE